MVKFPYNIHNSFFRHTLTLGENPF
jgi:hypothetical protein